MPLDAGGELAIVLASLDRMEEARDWLAKAFERAKEPEKLKLRALDEPELKEVWRDGPQGLNAP